MAAALPEFRSSQLRETHKGVGKLQIIAAVAMDLPKLIFHCNRSFYAGNFRCCFVFALKRFFCEIFLSRSSKERLLFDLSALHLDEC